MYLFVFIACIVVLVALSNLKARVEKLERLIKEQGISPTPAPIAQAVQVGIEQSQISTISPAYSQAAPVAATQSDAGDRFVKWLKEDWLLKLGALLLLIGFGWLTSYAFLNNWIGPVGRIVLGIAAGVVFIIIGSWRIRSFINQGGVFLVLGSTTILITIFAARSVYGFFTPLSALAIMFLSIVLVAVASVKYNNRALALMSLILAGIAPLLTHNSTPNYVELFSYLLIVVLGVIWVVALTGRRELTLAALLLIVFYSLPHLTAFSSADRGVLLLFAYAFAMVFFLANTAAFLRLKGKEIVPDLITAAGNGLFLLMWIMAAAQNEWKSLIIVAWMVVFVSGAFLVFKITQRREPFYVYAGIGIAMLAAATSLELKGATLTIVYTIESVIIVLLGHVIVRDFKITQRLSLLLIGPVVLSISSFASSAWMTGMIHKDFFVLLIVMAALFLTGILVPKRPEGLEEDKQNQLGPVWIIAGSFYAYALLWLSLHAVLQDKNIAVMISLVIYTLVGLTTYFLGHTSGKRHLKLYGGTLVGFVVFRLLFVDIWRMELTGRIITFFIIGTLLMTTAFFGKKKKETITIPNP